MSGVSTVVTQLARAAGSGMYSSRPPGADQASTAARTASARTVWANCVTTVLTPDIDALELARVCEEEGGLTIGLGVLDHSGTFRIGHMGHLNPPSILGTLGTIESAMQALDVPMASSGVAAAAAVIGRAFAG